MTKRTQLITPDVYQYVLRSSREPEVLARLRKATASVPHSEMQIGADQGELLALLVKLIGARRCIEIGTYTGYSALAVALALPADGLLVACDVNEEWTSLGSRSGAKPVSRRASSYGFARRSIRSTSCSPTAGAERSISRSSTPTSRITVPTTSGCSSCCARAA